jgi:hypothetical protein
MAGRLSAIAILAGLLLVLPSSAGASKRYSGCVAESHGCSHRFVGGDLPVLLFKDRRHSGTHYRVCVRDPRHRQCADRTSGKAGEWHRGGTWNIGAAGKHVVRWYVNGEQVARWKFRVLPEGTP